MLLRNMISSARRLEAILMIIRARRGSKQYQCNNSSDYLCSQGFYAKTRMISCTAEERETQSCSTPQGGGSPFSSGPHTRMKNHKTAEAGCPVPPGEIHHDQCIPVDDMNHVAGEGKGAWMQKNHRPRAAGEGRMSRSTRGGGGKERVSLCLSNCI